MLSMVYLKDLAERAAKAFAETVAALVVVDDLAGLLAVDWPATLTTAAVTTAASVVASLVSKPKGSRESASLVGNIGPLPSWHPAAGPQGDDRLE